MDIALLPREEIEQIVHDYVKDNLLIDIRRESDYGYGGDTVYFHKVVIRLGYEVICEASL